MCVVRLEPEAAVRMAQQAEAAGQRFGLIVTDRLEAPKDAFWMMDQICDQPALKDTSFVFLSSKRLEPSERVLKGVSHVSKPVRRASLLAAVRATQEPVASEGALGLDEDSKAQSASGVQRGWIEDSRCRGQSCELTDGSPGSRETRP